MFKLVNGGEKLPERATRYSCGFDVFANEDVTIGAGETVLVGLGIALDDMYIETLSLMKYREVYNEVAKKHLAKESAKLAYEAFESIKELFSTMYLELHPRSSLRAKGLGGGVGIIDMDFRDEIKMVISNHLTSHDVDMIRKVGDGYTCYFKKGDKIGQLILKRHEGYLMPLEYTKDEVRNGGFGSTGE